LDSVYCLLRKGWFKATPEEVVRQNILQYLTQKLDFPLSQIVIEQSLKDMPHLSLSSTRFPNRRADIVCYAKNIHPQYELFPLLLVECKAVKLQPQVILQATGYNFYLKAKYVALANKQEIRLGWYDSDLKSYRFVNNLYPYHTLINALSNKIIN